MIIPMSQRKANPKSVKPTYTDMECRMDGCENRVMSAVKMSKRCPKCIYEYATFTEARRYKKYIAIVHDISRPKLPVIDRWSFQRLHADKLIRLLPKCGYVARKAAL